MNSSTLGNNTTLSKRLTSDLTELYCLNDCPLIQTNKLLWKDLVHCKHDKTFLSFDQRYRPVFLMKKYYSLPSVLFSISSLPCICCVMSSCHNVSGEEKGAHNPRESTILLVNPKIIARTQNCGDSKATLMSNCTTKIFVNIFISQELLCEFSEWSIHAIFLRSTDRTSYKKDTKIFRELLEVILSSVKDLINSPQKHKKWDWIVFLFFFPALSGCSIILSVNCSNISDKAVHDITEP